MIEKEKREDKEERKEPSVEKTEENEMTGMWFCNENSKLEV